MRGFATVFVLIILVAASGCTSTKLANGGAVYSPDSTKLIPQVDTTNLLPANIPYQGSLIPNTVFKLSPKISFSLEKLIGWGSYVGIAYLVLDPLAPNWNIEEAPMADNYVHFSLKMKRYYSGGAGEARSVFQRRAKELALLNGFDGYRVIEYSEGMESSVLGSQRTAEGVVVLTMKPPSAG